MVDRNAFFSLKVEPNKVSLILTPAVGYGKGLDPREIDEYLSVRKLNYEKHDLLDAIANLVEVKEIALAAEHIYHEDESVLIVISNDKLKVNGRFFPPSSAGNRLNKEDIVNAMVSKGVKFGAREDVIQDFLNNREYCKDYELASAMLPVEGKNAEIRYYFSTDVTAKPKTFEDGSVDFHQLDNIVHVNKDDLLAELIPAVKGKPGLNVCGVAIKPLTINNKSLKYGKNIRINEERTKIYSMVNGHVSLVEDTVFVSDIYEIPQDVDASTGDITYEGNVTIKGNIRTGYKVIAKGDIIINGVVEGAIVEANGQIIVKRGVQGMNKAVLKADGNIVSKFIENAEVIAGGFVTTESILHSRVSAQGDITVNGKKGFISGGEVRSASLVHVKTAGSTMGTPTVLEVGVSPELLEEYRRMEKELPELKAEIERANQMMSVYKKKLERGEKLSPDKLNYLKNNLQSNKRIEEKIEEYKKRMQELQDEVDNNESGCIKVIDTIYPGCKIIISGVIQFVRSDIKHCRFVRDKADIKMMTY